jgi:hypothetical protein
MLDSFFEINSAQNAFVTRSVPPSQTLTRHSEPTCLETSQSGMIARIDRINYLDRLRSSIDRVRNPSAVSKSLAADKAAQASEIPGRLTVEVPFPRFVETIHVDCRKLGHWKSKGRHRCVHLKFKTTALGLNAPVLCSISCNVGEGASPRLAIRDVVVKHVRAVKAAGLKGLEELSEHYTVDQTEDGTTVKKGLPYGHYVAEEPPQKLGSVAKLEEIEENNDGNVKIRLRSGGEIITTVLRLRKARELAKRITFRLKKDGSWVKASSKYLEKVARRLAAFSIDDQKKLEEEGYRILLVDRRTTPKGGYPHNPKAKDKWPGGLLGYCAPSANVVVVPIDVLDRKNESDTLLHELGHAISDSRVRPNWLQRVLGIGRDSMDSDPEIGKLYQAYAKKCGHKPSRNYDDQSYWKPAHPENAWSLYALRSPGEYLAEGVARMEGGRGAQIQQKDPQFFTKLKHLFQKKKCTGHHAPNCR